MRTATSAVALSVMALCTSVRAQVLPDPPVFSFVSNGGSLDEALVALATQSHVSLAYDADLVRGKRAFCRRIRVEFEPLLKCILNGTGLDYSRLSSGTYVIRNAARIDAPGGIVGRVIDASTRLPVSGANVTLLDDGRGIASTPVGRFTVGSLDPGPRRIIVSHVAYQDASDSVFVAPFSTSNVTVALVPKTHIVEPIVVSGFKERHSASTVGPGDRDLDDLSNEGSRDILSTVDDVSGVRFGDPLSDVHVQGGAAGEHQYRLDGATIFVPHRTSGIVGPFSPFAIRQITIHKAGYGVGFGSQLSGVVDIEQEMGSGKPIGAVVQADELALNARASGRVGSGHGLTVSWMLGGRTDLWDVFRPDYLRNVIDEWSRPDTLLASLLENGTGSSPSDDRSHIVHFSDLHASLTVQTGMLSSFRLFHYTGSNRFGVNARVDGSTSDAYRRRHDITGIALESVLSSSVLAQVSAWSSNYEMQHPFDRSPYLTGHEEKCVACAEADDFNDVEEVGIRSRVDIAASNRHAVAGGAEAIRSASEMSMTVHPNGAALGPQANHLELGVWRLSAFLEDTWNVHESTELQVGLRLTSLDWADQAYIEPRVALRYDRALTGGGSWAVETAAGLYRQYLYQFDIATFGATALLPSIRFWRPVEPEESPPLALHVATSVQFQPNERWRFVFESFWKSLPHLKVLNRMGPIGASAPDLVMDADGRGFGASASIERLTDHVNIGLHYDFEISERRIPNRFRGAWQPVAWSVPHSVRFATDVKPLPGVSLTMRWRTLIGRTWAFRQAYYDYLEPNPDTREIDGYDFSDPSAHKLPAFSQLDLGAAYTFPVYRSTGQIFVQVLNVLDRNNQLDRWLVFDASSRTYRYIPRTWIMRSVSVSVRLSV